jgi:NAD(P)-dependent dehydrogenase (short-subunit alcohol dehydrogenase family)
MADRLRGKRALVTGGERGIGRAIALGLAREGADVAIMYYQQPDSANELVDKITSFGQRGLALFGDVSEPEQVRSTVEAVTLTLGGIDVLVNNAAILLRQSFLDIPVEDFDRILKVNVRGTFLMTQQVAREMVANSIAGSIINVSSLSAERAAPGLVHYQASKAGVLMLTRGTALELARFGIRVNAIAPGLTITDLNRDLMSDPAIRAERVSAVPLGRAGQPEDHVGAAVFLASDESAWITGATLAVDGGLTVT